MTAAPVLPTVLPTDTPVTAEIVERARRVDLAELPDDVRAVARHCVLDWIGVTLAGSAEPAAAIVRDLALIDGGAPQAMLVGTGERVTAAQAALVNGTASHALDFDDVMSAMGGHPTVPVLPALLAAAQQEGASGGALLAALVAGLETEGRVGRLMAPAHYAAGWHATGTVGTFGAAAAVAHLLGLDEERWRTAFGIAGTQAAGLKSMFGTMCKPLHAGKAAANGLLAARLAQRGFTAEPDVLDVAQGFAATQTTSRNPGNALANGAQDFDIRDVLFKFHAACYFTHSSIEGISRLRESNGITADDVAAVELLVPPQHQFACNILEPTTPLEGKFSLRYTAALALSGRGTDDHAFAPEMVNDRALAELRDRVVVTPTPARANTHESETVLRLRDGRELRTIVDMSVPAAGSAELDAQWRRLVDKFLALATPVVGASAADQVVATVGALEELDRVEDLVSLLRAPGH